MEQIKTREIMSAMADGRLEDEAFARGIELAATDPAAQQAWHTYHLIGDVLRSSDLAAGTPSQVFLSRLQVRLQQEAILAPPAAVLPERAPAAAANEDNFRWKLVAGFASIAAMAAIGWTMTGAMSGKPEQAQLAAVQRGGADAGSSERGVMIRDPRLDEMLAAHRQLGGASALQAPAGFLRNATFEVPAR